MALGSFLAGAGRIGQGIRAEEAAMRQARQQQLALEELNRQNEFRRLQLEAPVAEVPTQGLMLGAPMQVAEPEFAPAGQSVAAGLVSAPGAAPAAPTPAAPTPTRAPAAPAKPTGVTIPGTIKAKGRDRLGDGVAGFERIDPNASDASKLVVTKRNEAALGFRLSELGKRTEPWFTGLRTPFLSQTDKQSLELQDRAGEWYQSDKADRYFRQNPELLPAAERDPVGFYQSVLQAGKKGAPAPRPADTGGATRAGVVPFTPGLKGAGDLARSIGRIANAESGGLADPYQTGNLAGASSAFGRYQFTRGTWIDTYRKLNPGTKESDKQIWAKRTNPALQDRLMVKLTQDNASGLERAGLPVNDATLYLAHFAGLGGATKLLRADANTPVDRVLGEDQIDANASILRGRTVGQVAQWAAGKMSGAVPSGGTSGAGAPQQAGVNTGTTPTAAPTRIDPSNFYLANTEMVTQDMRVALQNRQELARMADMYRRAGMGDQFTQARLKVLDLDNSMLFLQGMQGISELAFANDPRRIAAVWSQYAGVPIELQPQTDGTYNIMVSGRVTQRGLPSSAIIDTARSAFDAEYRKSRMESNNAIALEQFKSTLRLTEESAKAVLQTAREAQGKLLDGQNQQALEIIKQLDPNGEITALGDGTGRAVLRVQGQTFMLDPGGNPIEGSEGLVTAPSAAPIAGLTGRSIGVGAGG
jgi:hypothetical protein